jgi:hypothetical protein
MEQLKVKGAVECDESDNKKKKVSDGRSLQPLK